MVEIWGKKIHSLKIIKAFVGPFWFLQFYKISPQKNTTLYVSKVLEQNKFKACVGMDIYN
jgi:hypothetical protein